MVFCTASGKALNLVPTAPVGVRAFFTSCTTPFGVLGMSLLRTCTRWLRAARRLPSSVAMMPLYLLI